MRDQIQRLRNLTEKFGQFSRPESRADWKAMTDEYEKISSEIADDAAKKIAAMMMQKFHAKVDVQALESEIKRVLTYDNVWDEISFAMTHGKEPGSFVGSGSAVRPRGR